MESSIAAIPTTGTAVRRAPRQVTRETRIKEFHSCNSIPVLGLREGSWLEVNGDEICLKGEFTARLFSESENPEELAPGILKI